MRIYSNCDVDILPYENHWLLSASTSAIGMLLVEGVLLRSRGPHCRALKISCGFSHSLILTASGASCG